MAPIKLEIISPNDENTGESDENTDEDDDDDDLQTVAPSQLINPPEDEGELPNSLQRSIVSFSLHKDEYSYCYSTLVLLH